MKTLVTALVAAATALGVTGIASPAGTPKLTGTVGPGFTITLKQGQRPVKTLKPGRYAFVVSDKASIHNFAIRGPGLNKALTAVGFTGTKTVTLTLKRGTYTFYCQPHASSMRGTFRVA
ncbi:MAG TPA: plastocyanin/azurin family copper-binding protein [Gaiellaceae bacterium]|nr:plastocyanin/azurin family copper-binding protein [Gaiellaceae bacterium]